MLKGTWKMLTPIETMSDVKKKALTSLIDCVTLRSKVYFRKVTDTYAASQTLLDQLIANVVLGFVQWANRFRWLSNPPSANQTCLCGASLLSKTFRIHQLEQITCWANFQRFMQFN